MNPQTMMSPDPATGLPAPAAPRTCPPPLARPEDPPAGWFKVSNSFIDDGGLASIRTLAALRVFLVLGRLADGGGAAWPSITYLAKLTGLGHSCVSRGIRELVERGMIVRLAPGGPGATTRYGIWPANGSVSPHASVSRRVACHKHKTQLAIALLVRYILNCLGQFYTDYVDPRYTTANALFCDLRAACGNDSQTTEQAAFARYQTAAWLIVDEISELRFSDYEIRRLGELVDFRYYSRHATILSGNGTRAGVSAALGPSIVSRCREVGLAIETTGWPDWRSPAAEARHAREPRAGGGRDGLCIPATHTVGAG